MMTTTHPHQNANQDPVIIRALSSITPKQADTIAQAVHASHQDCEIQIVDDYNGYLSVLIEPSVSRSEQKAFFISGTAQRLELFEAYNDDLALIATFSDVGDLSARLLDLIGQQ